MKRYRYVRTHASRITETSLKIIIESYGVPILEKETTKVFDSGYRGEIARLECEAGSGLGLSEVKRIVELHGGNVNINSEFKGGPHLNTLTIGLPFNPPRRLHG